MVGNWVRTRAVPRPGVIAMFLPTSSSSRLGLIAVTCLALAAPTVPTQSRADEPVVLEAPMTGLMGTGPTLTVTRVDPVGAIQMRFSKNVPRDLSRILTSLFSEGYYLLIAP